MAKTITNNLKTHIQRNVTSVCTCWKVTRTDGLVFAYTDHDEDVSFDALTYKAATGYNRTAVASAEGFAVDNVDIIGMLVDDEISEEDLRNGLFDYADVEVFLLNWEDPTMGRMVLRRGNFGEAIITTIALFKAELRGLAQHLNYTIGEVWQPGCRTDLGSTKCQVNLAAITQYGTVASVVDRRGFYCTAGLTGGDDNFNGGVLTWTSGANNGKKMEVVSWFQSTNLMILFLPVNYPIVAGDTFSVYPGCDKTRGANGCLKFNNVINYQGEPDLPGVDEAMRYPDARV
jgi:uncharacterized phage protein (TIGR02218 family)